MLLGTIEFAIAVIGIAIGLFVYKDGHGDRIRPFEIATVSKEITEKEFKKWKKNKNVEITPHGILDTTPVLNNGKITTEYIRTEIDIDNPSFPISDFTVEQRAVFTCDPQYKYASDVNYYDTKDEMTDAFADYYIALSDYGYKTYGNPDVFNLEMIQWNFGYPRAYIMHIRIHEDYITLDEVYQ